MKRAQIFSLMSAALLSLAVLDLIPGAGQEANANPAANSAAASPGAPEEANVRLSAGITLLEQLRALAGGKRRVTLLLKNGNALSGTLGEVGNGQLILTELAGKEFFDAMVRIEEISALQVQMRRR